MWSSSDDDDLIENTNPIPAPDCSRPVWQPVFFLLLWQSVYRVSNAAITSLLKFFTLFVHSIGLAYVALSVEHVLENIPSNIDAAHLYLWQCKDQSFVTCVVCPSCDSIYPYDDCFISRGTVKESKKCRHISYPNHPHLARRKECGTHLLKKVQSGRNFKLIPIKAYPYQPLHISLGRLIQKEGFVEACEKWRDRKSSVSTGYYGDIFDGQIWSDFGAHSQRPNMFLSSPFSYMVTLNVDWFQPFVRTQYSLGAIYLSIQNLPRELRYKEENILLVGLLPGPSEPSRSIDPYLSPLITELKGAWENGISLKLHNGMYATFRVALTCVSCDLPASKKVCGFLSHNAKYGCNKCKKPFQTLTIGNTDYSGYDRGNWPVRTVHQHRLDCDSICKQATKSGIRSKESELGCRFSVLLSLPYFDPIRNTVIDLMHNLYLGTGKHLFKLWIDLDLLGKDQLTVIEDRCRLFTLPNSVGRLPTNISSNYGGFKASQWRSWITVYSPIVLKGILPDEHLRCWLLYVRVCCILGKRILTASDINTADLLLLAFCKKFEQLYGKEHCTPNMHLHLHIKNCLLDYGPAHSFWCFSFERYNGLLGSYHTNQKNIEIQIMRKFINSQILLSTKTFLKPEFLNTLHPAAGRISSTMS